MPKLKTIFKYTFIIFFVLLSCNSAFAVELPSIVGEAKRVLLGPVDEDLGLEPIQNMPILIIPISIIEEKDLIPAENEDESPLLFKTCNDHPQTIHIKTDHAGRFSSFIPEGSYYLCTAYKFPWDQTAHEFANKRIDVEKNKQIKLSIIFNPDWKGLRIENLLTSQSHESDQATDGDPSVR